MICANPGQWPAVERVALEQPGENLVSALRNLLDRLQRLLAARNIGLPLQIVTLLHNPSHVLLALRWPRALTRKQARNGTEASNRRASRTKTGEQSGEQKHPNQAEPPHLRVPAPKCKLLGRLKRQVRGRHSKPPGNEVCIPFSNRWLNT